MATHHIMAKTVALTVAALSIAASIAGAADARVYGGYGPVGPARAEYGRGFQGGRGFEGRGYDYRGYGARGFEGRAPGRGFEGRSGMFVKR